MLRKDPLRMPTIRGDQLMRTTVNAQMPIGALKPITPIRPAFQRIFPSIAAQAPNRTAIRPSIWTPIPTSPDQGYSWYARMRMGVNPYLMTLYG